jgi:hypothetical protein
MESIHIIHWYSLTYGQSAEAAERPATAIYLGTYAHIVCKSSFKVIPDHTALTFPRHTTESNHCAKWVFTTLQKPSTVLPYRSALFSSCSTAESGNFANWTGEKAPLLLSSAEFIPWSAKSLVRFH